MRAAIIIHPFRRLAHRLTVSPFRLAAYVLHATGLDHIYKPRFLRHSALLNLTDEVVAELPKYSKSMTGAKMDLMNLIFVGQEADIKSAFKAAGWHRAHPASPLHLVYGFLMTMARRSYYEGPFTPHYVNIGLQDMAFQKLTKKKSFSQRHHLRIWRTGIVLPGDKRVWVGAASYDVAFKLQLTPPWLHHATDPNLDKEREYVARSLEKAGASRLKTVSMSEPILASRPYRNAYGAKYFTDGWAEVVEV